MTPKPTRVPPASPSPQDQCYLGNFPKISSLNFLRWSPLPLLRWGPGWKGFPRRNCRVHLTAALVSTCGPSPPPHPTRLIPKAFLPPPPRPLAPLPLLWAQLLSLSHVRRRVSADPPWDGFKHSTPKVGSPDPQLQHPPSPLHTPQEPV